MEMTPTEKDVLIGAIADIAHAFNYGMPDAKSVNGWTIADGLEAIAYEMKRFNDNREKKK